MATRAGMSSKVLPCSAAVAAGILLATSAVNPAQATRAALACGDTLTADTTLHADLLHCPGTGLVIGGNDVTLNLNGHTVSGDGVPAGNDDIHFDYGILVADHHDVTVTNGSVRAFDRGILFDHSRDARVSAMTVAHNGNRAIMFDHGSDDARAERNLTTDNGASGIAVVSSTGARIAHNRSLRNLGGAGVRLQAASNTTTTHNELDGNVFGVQVDDGSHNDLITANTISGGENGVIINFSKKIVVSGNHISGSGGGVSLESSDHVRVVSNQIIDSVASACDGCGIGIQIYGNDDVVARNLVIDSPRYGIEVDDFGDPGHSPATDNIVRDNVVIRSGKGIAIGPEAGGVVLNTLIKRNVVVDAVDDGIQLVGPSTGLAASTLTGNITVHNGDLGIEAVPGTIDGGGNKAAGNGNPLQCLNIRCR